MGSIRTLEALKERPIESENSEMNHPYRGCQGWVLNYSN